MLLKQFSRHCSEIVRHSSNQKQIITVDKNYVRHRELRICKRFGRISRFSRPWFLRYIPSDGHSIRINYVDTGFEDPDDQRPVILLLHGTPGSYYDYFRLIADFGERYRCIAPNFPDFNYTLRTGGCFWHSAEEKSELVADLLTDLNIKRVHCLITHSLSAYAASYLWIYVNHKPYFDLNSICMISPIGKFDYTHRERIRMRILSQLCRLQLSLPHFPILSRKQIGQISWPSIFGHNEIAMWKMMTENLSNYHSYHLRLQILAKHLRLPTLFIFSSNDKSFASNIYYNQLYELQVQADQFDRYEHYENRLVQAVNRQSSKYDGDNWIQVVDFSGGGHYLHNTHSHLIHSYVDELLDMA